MLRRSAFLCCLAVATGLSFVHADWRAPAAFDLIATAAAQQITLQPGATAAPPAASLVTPPMPGATAPESNAAPIPGSLTPLPSLTTATPVVLELFTAEGCASCLPADANVGQWATRRAVLVLTYHVDYWDYIGWRDSKAAPAFAQRQLGYVTAFGRNMVYTPQLIIAGKDESLGTDRDRLAMALADSAPVARMTPLRLLRDQDGRILADLPAVTLEKPATLWLITYRRQVETDILTGENAGKHLSSVNVVRSVQKLGPWSGLAEQVLVPIDLQAGGDLPADAAAVVANQGEFGPIIAATAVSFDSLR
jgi:hypothetical protein